MASMLPNIERLVPVIQADRDQLRRGLLSTGQWTTEHATAKVASVPDSDGALQMLARHRLAYSQAQMHRAVATRDDQPAQAWGDRLCSGCTLPRRDCECN